MLDTGGAMRIGEELLRQYRDDGVVRLQHALDPATLARAREAFDWSLAHPGPGAAEH